MLNDAILVVNDLVWNPSWFRLTTGIIWAQVQKFERFGACFCTCALIIWSVLLQVPSGAPKMISMPMARLAQTVHLSCTNTTTISKWIETRLHMTNVTEEIYRVRPKRSLSLWYVRHKPCTYLASRLALSPNKPKRASTWALSPRSTIRCVQNDFCAYGMFGANCAPIMHWHYHCLQMDWNDIPHDQCHLGDPSGVSVMISEPMVRSVQTVHLSCITINTITKQTKMSIHLSLVT
jgi:hypothetical protein